MRFRLLALVPALLVVAKAAHAQSPDSVGNWQALAVVLIAVMAVALVALAIGAWRLSDRVAKCCRSGDAAIRGYLFPLLPTQYKEGTGSGTYLLTRLGNFGRTPCILKESYLESVASEPSGSQAVYQSGRLLQHDLVLDANAQDVTLSEPAYPIVSATPSYLIGYFRYLDVFGVSHMTRYCYRIGPGAGGSPRAGSAAWNAFD
jgi:hypothetical protein